LISLLIIFALIGTGALFAWNYVDDAFDPGLFGQVLPFIDETPAGMSA
jgi:hypothetical protein